MVSKRILLFFLVFLGISMILSSCISGTSSDLSETGPQTSPPTESMPSQISSLPAETTAAPSQTYTFDLTEDLIEKPTFQLGIILQEDEALIIGGQYGWERVCRGRRPCRHRPFILGWNRATLFSFTTI